MKTLPKAIGISVLLLLGVLASGSAMADRDGHGGRGGGHGWVHGGDHRYGRGDGHGWGHGYDHGDRGHVHFGISLGVPLYDSGYYSPYYGGDPYPAYAYPPVVVQSTPPVYVEQGPAQAAPAPAQADWYYCAASRSYYPYVSECPGGWQRVPAQPPR